MYTTKDVRAADQKPEYQLTAEEKWASVGAVICNPTYDKSVDSNKNFNVSNPSKEGYY